MSRNENASKTNIFYDCGFTFTRNRIKKFIKQHWPSFVQDTVALITTTTVVSIIMASGLCEFVYFNTVKCAYNDYKTSATNIRYMFLTAITVFISLTCKCFDRPKIPTTRFFLFVCYLFGMILVWLYLPSYINKSCFKYPGLEYTAGDIFTTQYKFPDNVDSKFKNLQYVPLCISHKNHCIIKFLATELDILIYCCQTFFFIFVAIFVGYIFKIGREIMELPLPPSRSRSSRHTRPGSSTARITPSVHSSHHVGSSPQPLQLRGSIRDIKGSRISVTTPNIDSQRSVLTKYSYLPEIQIPTLSSPSSETEDLCEEEKDDHNRSNKRICIVGAKARKCMNCGEMQLRCIREPVSPSTTPSPSNEVSNEEKKESEVGLRQPVPQISQTSEAATSDYQKVCQYCGTPFDITE